MQTWQPDRVGTLVYLQRSQGQPGQQTLLIRKLTGHGQGLINAPGGKVEPQETAHAGAIRETDEEIGVRCGPLRLRACIRFIQLDGLPTDSSQAQAHTVASPTQWLGFAFTGEHFAGNPQPSPEAVPKWYPAHRLPWEQMWPTDKLWLPQALAAPPSDESILDVTLEFADERLQEHHIQTTTRLKLQDQLTRFGLTHLLP